MSIEEDLETVKALFRLPGDADDDWASFTYQALSLLGSPEEKFLTSYGGLLICIPD